MSRLDGRVWRVGVVAALVLGSAAVVALLLTVFRPHDAPTAPSSGPRSTAGDQAPSPVKPATGPAPVAEEREFVFDGVSRIVSPVDRFAPVTLEAWVKVGKTVGWRDERYVIGSDTPERSGISLGVAFLNGDRTKPPVLGAQLLPSPSDRSVGSDAAVPFDRWSHVAAAFGPDKTVLFLDGKPVGSGAATANQGGSPFVVGNAGARNPEHYFVGSIRGIRVSRGVRYDGEFAPPPAFEPDDSAVLIYDPGSVVGAKALDRSGHQNHGAVQGVRVRRPAQR